jgi:aminotransferase
MLRRTGFFRGTPFAHGSSEPGIGLNAKYQALSFTVQRSQSTVPLNRAVASIPPSLIRAINARKRPGDIDVGLGEPVLRPEMAPFEAALRWVGENGCPYSPNAGLPELRRAIAGYLSGALAADLAADNVCVTVGSQEALFLAIKTVVEPPRDEVLVVEPCYLAYPKLCVLEGIRHRMVALDAADGFQPRAGPVIEALRPETRLIVLNSPSNPTGRVWPDDELGRLANALERRTGPPVWVLADEVYREIHFGSEPPVSMAALYPHTLVAGSLSKSNALTGLRLGWLAGPAEAVGAAVKAHQFVNTAADTFAQRVALEIFRDPASLAAHRPVYAERRRALLAGAARHGIELIPPEGAFYALVRLPPPWADDSLVAAELLLERERVVTVPGRAFGDGAEGWLRISWGVEPDALADGLARIARFFASRA